MCSLQPSRRLASSIAFAACALVPPTAHPGPAPPQPPPATSGAPAAPSFDTLAARAAKARDAGRLDEAVGLYRRALAAKPSWLEGRWALATLLYDQDRFGEARAEFERVVRARPADGQARALLGLCRSRLGEREEALADLMKARELGIPAAEVRSVATFQAALLLNRLGDPDGAFELLRAFATDADDRPAVIEAFGLAMLRLPLMPDELAEDMRERVVLAGRGGYHLARGRGAVGRMALEELVSRFPSIPNAHYALGTYLLVDDPAGAIAELHRELGVSPGHYAALVQIALAELKRGRSAEALAAGEEAARVAPSVPAARLAHGRALLAAGRPEAAVGEMEAAVRLAPENPRLRFALGQAYAAAGRDADAARERAEFLKLQKASGGAPVPPGEEPGRPSPDGG